MTTTLFSPPQTEEGTEELLKRYVRVRENILLGKKQMFDSRKFSGRVDESKAAEFSKKWDMLVNWIDEHELLIMRLDALGYTCPDWRCKRCNALITVAWDGNETCRVCTGHHRKIEEVMEQRGYMAIEIAGFGGEVIVVIPDNAKPPTNKQVVTYTISEVMDLRFSSTKGLREIHKIKKLFGGRVSIEARTLDPRPDYTEDHAFWEGMLLALKDTRVRGALDGFRCFGARIGKNLLGMAEIQFDPTREGFTDQADFDKHYNLWLHGHEKEIRDTLAKVGR